MQQPPLITDLRVVISGELAIYNFKHFMNDRRGSVSFGPGSRCVISGIVSGDPLETLVTLNDVVCIERLDRNQYIRDVSQPDGRIKATTERHDLLRATSADNRQAIFFSGEAIL